MSSPQSLGFSLTQCLDYGRAQDISQLQLTIHHLFNSDWGACIFSLLVPVSSCTEQNATAHHRYSEFESLRLNLSKLYPTLIIPPIPSKNTIGDYAVKQGRAKEDAALIARRKRILQTFLNRLARHPILSNEHVFHRFLDGEVSWVRLILSWDSSVTHEHVRQRF